MSKSVIGSLRVNLGLDSAQFKKGLTEAQRSLANAQKQFAAMAGVATLAFGAVTAAALKGAQAIDANAKAARRLDSSVAGFRALEMAADDAGVSLSSLADNVQTMNREIAKNSQGAQDALQRLGIVASDLANLDADQKLALIADQVQGLGLNSAEASVLLQQLGVRNREMALLVTQGGDALRAARVDVEQFGLAISDVDAARIEAANDELAGLADITTYIGDQLALKFVPAMGNMAKAMTDSLREGGALRTVLDAMIGSLDRVAAYIGVLVTGFGVRYVAALAAARFATLSLAGSLALLRTAIIRTGIGVLVVGAGELVLWLGRVIERVGGVGKAFELLAAMGKSAAAELKSWFLRSIADITKGFEDLTWNFARGLNDLFGTNLQGMSGAIFTSVNDAARAALGPATAARNAVNDLRDSIADTGDTATDAGADVSDSMATIAAAAETAGGAGRAAGGAIRDGLQPAIPIIEEATTAFQNMASQGVDSLASAFADFMVRGFNDFKSFANSILNTFKQMISQMIATAIANPIKIAMGLGGSVAGTAAQAGTGLLGGVGAGVGAFAGGIGSGLSVVGSGFAAGGLGGAAQAGMGAFTGGIGMGGAAGFGTALGAAIPVIGAAVLAIGLFRTKTKELDNGLKVTIDGMDAAVETFKKTQTSRFFGLSKSTSTSTGEADSATADPIIAAVSQIQQSVLGAASAIGVGAEAFDNFAASITISLKGLSDDQAVAEIQKKLGEVGDQFAGMIPHLAHWQNEGEALTGTLDRLATGLTTFNSTMQYFGQLMFETNLHSAGVAARFIEMAGGIDAFNSAHQFFAQNFFTAEEQLAMSTAQLTRDFEALGLTVPQSSMALRELIQAQNLGTEAGQAMYLALLNIAPAFKQVEGAAQSLVSAAAAAAAQAQAAAASQADSLKRQLLQLQGDTEAIRDLDMGALLSDEARAIQQQIYDEQDRQERAAKAAAAAAKRAQAAQQVRNEMLSLETRYLQAIGDVATLREREIAALAPANQAFGRMVMMLEDAKKAADALSEVDFASLVDFNRARGRALNMVPANFNAPVAPVTSVSSVSASDRGNSSAAEQRELLNIMRRIERNTQDTTRNTSDLVFMNEGAA